LIDWNAEVATLTPEQKQRVKALIDELQTANKAHENGHEKEGEEENYPEPPVSLYYPAKTSYDRADIMQIMVLRQ